MSETPTSNQDYSIASIISATAAKMQAELQEVRASFDHSGLIGSAAEEIVAEFLNSRLPLSVRAVAGKAIDSKGNRSKQLDVIVYDAARTPLLFTSARNNNSLVPIEGILAVIEVKTRLNPEELRRSVANCASVKQLERGAWISEPVSCVFKLYGQTWTPSPPVYYSIFAFESDGLYAELLNDKVGADLPLHEQIDTIVCLDRGLCINATVDVAGQLDSTTLAPRFTSTPEPTSIRLNALTKNALVVWYGVSISTILERLPSPTVDVTAYLKDELNISGTVEGGAAVKKLEERLTEQLASAIELDPEIANKLTGSANMTPAEVYTLLRHPMHDFKELSETTEIQQSLKEMKRTAASQSQEQWVGAWFPGRDPHKPLER